MQTIVLKGPDVPHPLQLANGGMVREYDVVLQRDDGQTCQLRYHAPWTTEKDFVSLESIANAAAATSFVTQGKQHRYAGISAMMLDELKFETDGSPERENHPTAGTTAPYEPAAGIHNTDL
jgi:hypothetical protein